MISMIVALNHEGVIGKNNDLPWAYKGDLKWFSQNTRGSTVVMGRKTWESLPKKPLPKRTNVVITSHELDSEHSDVETAGSVEEVLENRKEEDVWLMGGSRVYQEGVKHADRLLVTLVPDIVSGPGLVHFPLNTLPWQTNGEVIWDTINFYTHPYESSLKVMDARKRG